jgi:hypothetical protein
MSCFDPNMEVGHVMLCDDSILQFQFHAALCRAANSSVPLHQCSIFGSKQAGLKLDVNHLSNASRPSLSRVLCHYNDNRR